MFVLQNSSCCPNQSQYFNNFRKNQRNEIKRAEKILRLNKKNFEVEELPHELFLTTTQTTKMRNAFANNMSTDNKLSEAQISKKIQSGGYFGSWLVNFGKKH